MFLQPAIQLVRWFILNTECQKYPRRNMLEMLEISLLEMSPVLEGQSH